MSPDPFNMLYDTVRDLAEAQRLSTRVQEEQGRDISIIKTYLKVAYVILCGVVLYGTAALWKAVETYLKVKGIL